MDAKEVMLHALIEAEATHGIRFRFNMRTSGQVVNVIYDALVSKGFLTKRPGGSGRKEPKPTRQRK